MFLFLFACAIPELSIRYQDEIVTEIIQDGRFLLEHPTITIELHNEGDKSVELEKIIHSEQLIFGADFPLVLEPEEKQEIQLQYVPDLDGLYSEEIVFQGNIDEQYLRVKGEIYPYIQLNLEEELPEVSSAFSQEFESQELVGAVIGIVQGADIIWLEGLGYADLDEQILLSPQQHRFRWASLSKGLTAYAIMQQVEEGVLDLDVSISEYMDYLQPEMYLPEECTELDCAEMIPADREDISLRLLLSHTAGIQHYQNGVSVPVPSTIEAANPDINTGMEWALELFIENPLVHIPNSDFNYSTFGYNLAGVVLEKGAGRTLAEMVETEIAQKIGITTLSPDYYWDPEPDRVMGYDLFNGNVIQSANFDVSWKLAGGGFQSTVEDLARYCAMLLGNELLSEENKEEELWKPSLSSYGFGFYIYEGTILHTGAQQSTRTALLIDRNQELCYVAMSNSTWADPFDIVSTIQQAYQTVE